MRLSILIPVYNVERYIRRCLDSVYGQLPEDCEVVIVDDGCTDSSASICDEYKIRFPNITKVIHKANSGAYSTRNLAMDNAEGKYLWLIDPDDYIADDCMQAILQMINTHEPDVLSFAYKRCNDTKFYELENNYKEEMLTGKEYLLKYTLNPYLWSKVYRTSFVRNNSIRFNDSLYSQGDWLFNMFVFYFAKKVVLTDIYGYNYFENPYSTLRNPDINKLRRNFNNSLIVAEEFERFVKGISDAPLKQRFRDWQGYNISGFLYAIMVARLPIVEITSYINKIKDLGLYPAPRTSNKKAQRFLMFANWRILFLSFCRLYKFLKD